MTSSDVKIDSYQSITPLVETNLKEMEALIRAQAEHYHPDIIAALNIILSSGGKRVRPTVSFLVGEILGAPHAQLLNLAAAIELLHTATLVHDDLIDGSLLRRGMPTLNSQWSPGATVLTGDFFFACAARLAAATDSLPAVSAFSQTLVTIVNGEIEQLFGERCLLNRENYYRRIYAKTASLFETSALSATYLNPSPEEIQKAMQQYGYNVGMAFQIVDDILDFTSQAATLGKPVGSDLRQGLITLPTLMFAEINPANEQINALLEGKCSLHPDQMNQLIAAIGSSDAIQQAFLEARRFVNLAIAHLDVLPADPRRDALKKIAEFIVDREL